MAPEAVASRSHTCSPLPAELAQNTLKSCRSTPSSRTSTWPAHFQAVLPGNKRSSQGIHQMPACQLLRESSLHGNRMSSDTQRQGFPFSWAITPGNRATHTSFTSKVTLSTLQWEALGSCHHLPPGHVCSSRMSPASQLSLFHPGVSRPFHTAQQHRLPGTPVPTNTQWRLLGVPSTWGEGYTHTNGKNTCHCCLGGIKRSSTHHIRQYTTENSSTVDKAGSQQMEYLQNNTRAGRPGNWKVRAFLQ